LTWNTVVYGAPGTKMTSLFFLQRLRGFSIFACATTDGIVGPEKGRPLCQFQGARHGKTKEIFLQGLTQVKGKGAGSGMMKRDEELRTA